MVYQNILVVEIYEREFAKRRKIAYPTIHFIIKLKFLSECSGIFCFKYLISVFTRYVTEESGYVSLIK